MLQVRLKVVGGKHEGEIIEISSPKFLIGREQDCHIRPNSELVSRHHCVLTVDDFGVRMRDLGSTNGTFVNGERIRGQVELKPGDRLSVGKLNFELLVADDEAADQPPQAPDSAEDASVHSETAELSTGDTQYQTPAAPAEPVGDSTIVVGPPPGMGQPGYPPPPGYYQQPAGYPPYPMAPGQYPQPPGYYPPYGGYYPQPGMPYPQQGTYPQQAAPAQQPGGERLPEVRLPDPSTTGAAAQEPQGEKKEQSEKGAEENPSVRAAEIIKQHMQRRPTQ